MITYCRVMLGKFTASLDPSGSVPHYKNMPKGCFDAREIERKLEIVLDHF